MKLTAEMNEILDKLIAERDRVIANFVTICGTALGADPKMKFEPRTREFVEQTMNIREAKRGDLPSVP